jgi:hypothetical protein
MNITGRAEATGCRLTTRLFAARLSSARERIEGSVPDRAELMGVPTSAGRASSVTRWPPAAARVDRDGVINRRLPGAIARGGFRS